METAGGKHRIYSPDNHITRGINNTYNAVLKYFISSVLYPSRVVYLKNADFDGDEINQLGLTLKELKPFFDGFSPQNMLTNRTDETIKMDISPTENISLYILSDK